MNDALVTVAAVEKRFTSVTAVADVSFTIPEGEIFALLGPNGAGKTTMLRMLLGLIHPDRGTVSFKQRDGSRARSLPPAEVGYLPEDRGLYPDVEVLRTLSYFGVLRGMQRAAARRAAEEWLEKLGLHDRRHEPLKALSKGNQQKVQFISAVLHRPHFVVLDEPFSGLDPLNQDLFLSLIREFRDGGATVLLSAHQMHLVERLAAQILVLNRGRVLLSGSIADIRRRWQTGHRLKLQVSGEHDFSFIRGHEHVRVQAARAGEVEVFVADGHALGPVLALLGAHLNVREIESAPVTLHDVYVGSIAQDTSAEAAAE